MDKANLDQISMGMFRDKVKLSLCLIKHHAIKTYEGAGIYFHAFLTSAPDGNERSISRPDRFAPGTEPPSIQWIGGWVGLTRSGRSREE